MNFTSSVGQIVTLSAETTAVGSTTVFITIVISDEVAVPEIQDSDEVNTTFTLSPFDKPFDE